MRSKSNGTLYQIEDYIYFSNTFQSVLSRKIMFIKCLAAVTTTFICKDIWLHIILPIIQNIYSSFLVISKYHFSTVYSNMHWCNEKQIQYSRCRKSSFQVNFDLEYKGERDEELCKTYIRVKTTVSNHEQQYFTKLKRTFFNHSSFKIVLS